jgi:hypothetical protein
MHTLGFVLVLFASMQSAPSEERTLPFFTNTVPREPVIRMQMAPQAPRVQPFAPPDRHESANAPRYFVCPKDGAMLRVPVASADATFKCPVDGTVMKAGAGQGRKFFLLEE